MTIIAYAIAAFNLVKAAMEAGKAFKDVYDIIERTNKTLAAMEADGRGPNAEEWAALNKESDDIRALRPDVD